MFLGASQQQQKKETLKRLIPTVPGTNYSVTPADDFQSRVLVELGRFRDWASASDKLYLGEFGIPNDKGADQSSWNDILDIMVQKCICDNISWTFWASGHEWDTSYNLSPYESSGGNPGGSWASTPSGSTLDSSISEASGKVDFVGVNYAGHEFGETEQDPSAAPSASDFTFHKNKGIQVFRYPLGEPSWTTNWLWVPSTNSFRDSDIQHVENVLNRAQTAGIGIILDMLHPGGGAKYATIDGTAISNASAYAEYLLYADALLNHTFNDANGVSTTLKEHPALFAVDPVNEPQTLGSGGSNSWLTISQDIVDDFRDSMGINYQGTLMIALPHYSGVQDINSNAPSGPWITDPADDFYYEGHYYPEANHTGTFSGSYASEVTAASSFTGQGSFSCTA